jgi:hypothetical protein
MAQDALRAARACPCPNGRKTMTTHRLSAIRATTFYQFLIRLIASACQMKQ